jgi:hypothetical protein
VATRVRQKGALAPAAPENEVLWTLHGVQDRAKGIFEPTFESDLLRLFEATYLVNTVFAPANPAMKHPAVFKLARQTKLDDAGEDPADVAAGKAPRAHIRFKVFNTLRPWDEAKLRLDAADPAKVPAADARRSAPPTLPSKDPPKYEDRYEAYQWTMPLLFGDSERGDYASVRNAVTELQYRVVKQWYLGKFKDTKPGEGSFETIKRSGILTPGGLDRSALDRTVGGPFFPGIEVSWLIRNQDIYSAPLRMKLGHVVAADFKLGAFQSVGVAATKPTVGPGFLSQQMAQPWHADFHDCARIDKVGWWPAQRPDDVARGGAPANPTALLDPSPAQANDWKETVFRPSGIADMAKLARNITVTTRGSGAALGPKEATVRGKDDAGNAITDTIPLLSVASTSAGEKVFKSISEVSFTGVTPPKNTGAKLAIGLSKSAPASPNHEPSRIEGPTVVPSTPREITTFDPKLNAELAASPRPLRFTVSGAHPEEAPLKVVIEGSPVKGGPTTDTVILPRGPGSKSSAIKFRAITKIRIDKGQPKSLPDLNVSIGIGTDSAKMEEWALNVGGMNGMIANWSRLGFVFGGAEVERDPAL